MLSKKPILIVSIVIILIVAVLVVWKLIPGDPESTSDTSLTQTGNNVRSNEGSNTDKGSTTDTIKGTLLDLISLGRTVKCTFSTETDGVAVSGVTYVAGNNMRNDFDTTDLTGKVIKGHMISDGEWVYTWSSTVPQGFKMRLNDFRSGTTPENSGEAGENSTNVLNNDYDYNCSPWASDEALFEIPSDIEFMDFSETLKNFGSSSDTSMCAACDYAENEDDRIACKLRLGCQ